MTRLVTLMLLVMTVAGVVVGLMHVMGGQWPQSLYRLVASAEATSPPPQLILTPIDALRQKSNDQPDSPSRRIAALIAQRAEELTKAEDDQRLAEAELARVAAELSQVTDTGAPATVDLARRHAVMTEQISGLRAETESRRTSLTQTVAGLRHAMDGPAILSPLNEIEREMRMKALDVDAQKVLAQAGDAAGLLRLAADQQRRIAHLEEAVGRVERGARDANAEAESMRNAVRQALAESEQTTAERDKAAGRVAVLERHAAEWEKAHAIAMNKLRNTADLEARLVTLTGERDRLLVDRQQQPAEIARLRTELVGLRADLDTAQRERTEAVARDRQSERIIENRNERIRVLEEAIRKKVYSR